MKPLYFGSDDESAFSCEAFPEIALGPGLINASTADV